MTYRPMTYRPEDWKPGDVAMVTLSEDHPLGPVTLRGMRAEDYDGEPIWRLLKSDYRAGGMGVASARRLYVGDPESDEDVEAFQAALDLPGPPHIEDRIRAALRTLARPPKPDEPLTVGALVWARRCAGDAHLMWARDGGGSWVCLDGTAKRLHWSHLTDVEVIR
jgi:hypothetical protein